MCRKLLKMEAGTSLIVRCNLTCSHASLCYIKLLFFNNMLSLPFCICNLVADIILVSTSIRDQKVGFCHSPKNEHKLNYSYNTQDNMN